MLIKMSIHYIFFRHVYPLVIKSALTFKHCCHIKVDIAPGNSKAVYLKVDPCDLKPGVYTPINVIAREGDRIVGGVTFIAIQSRGGVNHGC